VRDGRSVKEVEIVEGVKEVEIVEGVKEVERVEFFRHSRQSILSIHFLMNTDT